jgi:hypothetical protein
MYHVFSLWSLYLVMTSMRTRTVHRMLGGAGLISGFVPGDKLFLAFYCAIQAFCLMPISDMMLLNLV